MRILYVLHQFFPEFSGGTERVTLNLARMAQRAGHYVHVLACAVQPDAVSSMAEGDAPAATWQTVYQGVPVTLLPRASLPTTADYSFDLHDHTVHTLADWMQAQRFDVVHVLHPMRMAAAIKAAQQCGLPLVLTLTDFYLACSRINLVTLQQQPCAGPDLGQRCGHDCLVPPWSTASLRTRHQQAQAILASASVRVAPSAYVAQRYHSIFPDVPVQVIPHGIDMLGLLQHVQPVSASPATTLRFGYVGTIVPQKGLQVLLQALALQPGLPLQLKVAGSLHGDPVYQQDIQRLAAADPRVQLLGQQDVAGVARVLASLDVLCVPSTVPESYSLVLREAAALGVPALVSDLGAPAELVRDTGCGEVLPAGDAPAWAQAIAQLCQHRERLDSWRQQLPLPLRIEEEAFFYESLYRRSCRSA